MSASATPAAPREPIRESLRIAGEKVSRDRIIEVRHPYSGELVGTVPKATLDDVKRALQIARGFRSKLTRHDRYKILMKAGAIIASKRDDLARLITLESGLAARRDHRDNAIQSSAEPGDPQSGSRGGHQQPCRTQAQREDTADRLCARGYSLRGGAAASNALGSNG